MGWDGVGGSTLSKGDVFWNFMTLSHLWKERQKFHDIDSEEFQLYKHAVEEEYRMQVFCDRPLILLSLIIFLSFSWFLSFFSHFPDFYPFIVTIVKCRRLPLGRSLANPSSRWVVGPVTFPLRLQIQIKILCSWPVYQSYWHLLSQSAGSGGTEGNGVTWRSRGAARRYP